MSDAPTVVKLILPGGRRVDLGRSIDKERPNQITYQIIYPERVDWDEIAAFMAVVTQHDRDEVQ